MPIKTFKRGHVERKVAHQEVVFLKVWRKVGMCPKADPVPLASKPDRVWTLYGHQDEAKPPILPFRPVHHNGAFLEDYVHDWNWRNGTFHYASRVIDRPVWVLLEWYEKE